MVKLLQNGTCTKVKLIFNAGRKLDVCHSCVRVLFLSSVTTSIQFRETSSSTIKFKQHLLLFSLVICLWVLNQGDAGLVSARGLEIRAKGFLCFVSSAIFTIPDDLCTFDSFVLLFCIHVL